MRLLSGRALPLIVGLATLAAMAGAGPASAAPVAGAGAGSGGFARPHQTTSTRAYPQLTTNTKAGCNTKPKKGYARCFAVVRTPADHAVIPDAGGPPTTALGPADIQDAYKLPATGEGQTVAVVDAFGYSNAEQDLAVFRDHYDLPPCTTDNGCFTKVDQRGGTDYPPNNAGWALETALDLDAVSSACPKCHILLVEGDSAALGSLGVAVDQAVTLGAKYVSNSYGAGDVDATAYDHHYDHPGVAVTVSTGDTGNVVNWPSSNPNVVAVGGTRLTRDDSAGRGWAERPWTGGGSGCSTVEPKPDYQSANGLDTHCAMRATADIAADADPASGLAVYDTLGRSGWLQVGGTSLSSPLVAAMYALAGEPATGTYPVTYPYDPSRSAGLFDITEGVNGLCGTVLCTAGPGWDGPTGMGTPNGVSALSLGPQGDITGRVTDADSGDPIAGATVSTPEGYTTKTETSGEYELNIPVGTYDVTVHAYGYADKTDPDIQVVEDQTTQGVDFALGSVPDHTLSGTVTDGSGHGWPLYAEITIDGYPGGDVYTDPYTGHYSVALASQAKYTLHVTPVYPGYQTNDVKLQIGTSDVQRSVESPVDLSSCAAPGYGWVYDGAHTGFTGWTAPQDGWTVTDNNGSGVTWAFGDPGKTGNVTGGSGGFAVAEPFNEVSADTDLVSPVVDLTDQANPEVGFDAYFFGQKRGFERVDLSLDGGQTWDERVWQPATNNIRGRLTVPLPQAAGQPAVRVRFHLDNPPFATNGLPQYGVAQLDDVFIGTSACEPLHGGLVAGTVHDDNTGDALSGATVASIDGPGESGRSATTSADPNLPGGFYWLFSSLTGSHPFTIADGRYTSAKATVNVASDEVTRQDWTLAAGHLTLTPAKVQTTETLGGSKEAQVTIGNDGTSPVEVELGERSGGFTAMTRLGAAADPSGLAPSASSWTDIADYPIPIGGNAVAAHAGKIYSAGGVNIADGRVANSYVYDPSKQRWSRIADVARAVSQAAAGFIDGTMYVAGGVGSSEVDAYHPSADRWSKVASLPENIYNAGSAVLDGQLYVVGGSIALGTTRSVYRYDPDFDRWTRLADYPEPLYSPACAGVAGEVVCAGGEYLGRLSSSTYIYHPGTDTWSRGADMPYPVVFGVSSAANDRLQIIGGWISDTGKISNRAVEYDPASDTWSQLPDLNHAVRGDGACGVVVGGSEQAMPRRYVQRLPGYDQCGDEPVPDVPWLSESATSVTLAPGESVTVTLTMDSSAVSQPGDYGAWLVADSDSPYLYQPVDVTMHVTPVVTSGKIAGTVTNAASGDPVGGVTVQICSNYDMHRGGCGPHADTVTTDQDGRYQLWLDIRYSPVQVIAAKDGYVQQVRTARIKRGKTRTVDFALHAFG